MQYVSPPSRGFHTIPPAGGPATVPGVSDLTRSGREQRAYRLVVTSGVAGTVAVVGVVLAAIGVFGWGVPILAVLVCVVAWFMFRRTVAP